MFHRAFVSFALFAPLAPLALSAQEYSLMVADGVVIPLGDGRLAVLKTDKGAIVVSGLLGEKTTDAALDIQMGDKVVGFQQLSNPTLERINADYEALSAGSIVLFSLQRGSAPPHKVRYSRPDTPAGSNRRAVRFNGNPNAAAGAWVSAGEPSKVTEMQIAGARIQNNKQGIPEVMSRGSHPAAATVTLRAGDVITAINGKGIAALAGLEKYYMSLQPGDEVALTITRDGREMQVTFRKPNE